MYSQKCDNCEAGIVEAGCEGETRVVDRKEMDRIKKEAIKQGYPYPDIIDEFNYCPVCGLRQPVEQMEN